MLQVALPQYTSTSVWPALHARIRARLSSLYLRSPPSLLTSCLLFCTTVYSSLFQAQL